MPLSEESGIGYRKTHLISPNFARFFTLPRTFFITIFPTAFSFRSRMTGSQVIPFCKKLLFVFLLILAPSDGLRLHTFLSLKAKRITHFYSVALLLEKWFACLPTSGDGLRFLFFLAKQMKHSLETQFTPAVILERRTEQE